MEYDATMFGQDVRYLAQRLNEWRRFPSIVPVPRGGWPLAAALSLELRTPIGMVPQPGCLIVDDIIDSGATRERFRSYAFAALITKERRDDALCARQVDAGQWVSFPWESNEAPAEDAVVRLIQVACDDPKREGLVETPRRYLSMLTELTQPQPFSFTTFDANGHDQMITQTGIRFVSLCEHHLLPFLGEAVVSYIPCDRVVGLSKLARAVEACSRGLLTQEAITDRVADSVMTNVKPLGCGVQLRAEHLCMTVRGVKAPGTRTVTTALRGVYLDDQRTRAEFLDAVR